jgi:hypothetical protein
MVNAGAESESMDQICAEAWLTISKDAELGRMRSCWTPPTSDLILASKRV